MSAWWLTRHGGGIALQGHVCRIMMTSDLCSNFFTMYVDLKLTGYFGKHVLHVNVGAVNAELWNKQLLCTGFFKIQTVIQYLFLS